jgi:hypothetical protein
VGTVEDRPTCRVEMPERCNDGRAKVFLGTSGKSAAREA